MRFRLNVCRALLQATFLAAVCFSGFAQTVTVSPTSVAFGNQVQGTQSSVHSVTLKNGQKSAITVTSITSNLADYAQTNTCPASPATLAAGASCTVSITFTPSALGARNGTLTITDTGASSPQKVTFTGTGIAPSLVSIAVTPSLPSVAAGNTQQFTATGTYNNGTTQNLTSSATWSSSAATIATISSGGLATGVAQGSATITAKSGTISGSTTLTVTAAVLTSISVTPASPSIAAGKTQQFTATGTYSNHTTQTLTSSVTWTSSATTVATISSGGLATGVAKGSSTISAKSGTISGSTTLTVTAAVLSSISVTPVAPSIAAGKTQQFTATGNYSNGTTQNLTSSVTWSSSNTSAATIKSNTGLATAVASGSATITAKSGTISGSTTLTVTPPTLTSISVTPATASVAAGSTQQFTATGTYSNSTTQDLTSTATWTSSANSVTTVNNAGLASSLAAGSATITATSGTISGSVTLTVTPPVLTSIAVIPATVSLAAGYTQQFTATGTYSNSTTQNLTTTVAWTSSAVAVAKVSSAGVASSVVAGSTTISAASGTISGAATLTVTPPVLTSISIAPLNASIAKGTNQQFTATGSYSDGSTQDVTSAVSWSSSSTSVATIAAGTGLAAGTGVGSSTITASSGSISSSATLNVGQATLISIAVTPANPSFALGTTQNLIATGTYSDGSTLDLTSTATWNTSDSSIATVDNQGHATSVAIGSTNVTATSGAVRVSTTLTVTPAVLVSIAVTPAIPTIPLGTTQQFSATGTYTDGSTQNITGTVQWSSDTLAVATISGDAGTQGLATSLTEGSAIITATSGSIAGSTTLTVSSAALVSLAVTPANPSIALGTTQQFTATGTFTDGSAQDLSSKVTWTSDTVGTATINTTGLVQSEGIGTATLTATSGTMSASTLLTVTAATLVSIAINPQSASVALGTTQQFTATGTFTDGTTQDLTQSGYWTSTAAGVATISDTAATAGLASTLGTGTTNIAVSSGSVSAQATLVVTPAVLASIAITPQSPSIALGTTQQFTAAGTYTDGTVQDLTSVVTWSYSDATVVIISNAVGSNGLATSSGQGTATISATFNSISSSTSITVGQPALVSITINPASASIPLGTAAQFAATGIYTDGSTQDITGAVTWASSASSALVTPTGLVTGTMLGSSSVSATSGSVSSSANVVIASPVLIAISVSPTSASIAKGTSQQFTATGTYSDGSTQDVTSALSWSSSSTSVATVAASGLAAGTGLGSATVMASSGSISNAAVLNVGQAALLSIAVTPASPSFALGTTQNFTATGIYTDGSTLDLTSTATWTSNDSSIATVDDQGHATSVALGNTSVTAASGAVSGSATLTVTPAVLVSIAVTPAIPTIPLGTTEQFSATGAYTDGSTQNITATVQWSSDTLAVATIGTDAATAGLATSVTEGSASITATSGSITGSTTLTVSSATLVSLAVTPANPSIALGTTQQFSATGTFTDGSTQDLSSKVTWMSDTVATATITSAGLAQSFKIGSAAVTATSGTITASTQLTVTTATLVSIAINPQSASVALGTTQQFTATGTFTDGTTQDLTQSVHWSSTATGVANISDAAATAGLASTLGAGSTTIAVESGSVSAQATLVVTPAVLAAIAITPQSPTIALGTTQQFTATGTYTDGTTQDLTSVATWNSSDAMVAIFNNAVGSYGLAASSGQGTATISASFNSISSSTSITVGQASLASLSVTPSSIAVSLGYPEQFAAIATYSDGSTQDVTSLASWNSSVPAVATVVASNGYATSWMQGSTNISATYMNASASGVLTVIPPALVSIVVSPVSNLMTSGNSLQLTATAQYSDGSSQDVTFTAIWSTSSTLIATVNAGLLAAISPGTVTVTAAAAGITSAAATVQVGSSADFYVATNGSDAWSGTLFTPNSTNTDGPFATIGKAQSAVQNLLKNPQGRTNAVTILVRGGSYYSQSLAFSSSDSGTAALGVVWQNYPNEVPVLSGGIPLSGWINTGGNVYQISLPINTSYFENLFYNGQRRLRPRSGSYLGSYGHIAATVFMSGAAPPAAAPNPNCSVYVTGKGWECFDRFQANCSDVSRSWQNLNSPYPPGDIELVDFEIWTDSKLRIQSIDQSCVVYLTGPTAMVLPGHGFIPNHRYVVENVKDALTLPGQWFLDRSASPWILTYLANMGENPNADTVLIPQMPQVLVATNLQYVTFRGLAFQHDNYTVPPNGYASQQQDPGITAAVACRNCQNVTFDSDTISQTSGTGIEFTTITTTSTTSHNAFQNGALYDVGAIGIRVGKPPATADTDANVPQFTTVQNNLIEGYSRVFPSGVGIIQGSGHDNTYTHNDIYDGYHSGIEVCLPPSCAPGKKNSTGSFNNVASFNHIHHLFEGLTSDGGAIYFSTGGTTFTPAGNQILNNKIHDLSDASVFDSDGYGGSGVYLDSYTGLVNVQNNLIFRTSGNGVKITSGPQIQGQANSVKNNIVAYARLGGILNNTPYVGTTCPANVPTIFTATNNLFYFDRQSTSTPAYFLQQGCDYTCGASITALHNWQNNLYWRINGDFQNDTKAFHTQPKPGTSQLCTLGTNTWTFYSFGGWQALGEDLSSSVIINPGFNAPAYPTDDYSLPNGSPNSFFTPFDPAQAGRSNPIIKPTNPMDIPATFPTASYNPATDY